MQAVEYVTKSLDTNEAILAESGMRESLTEYFILREKAVLAAVELESIESDALVAKRLTHFLPESRLRTIQAVRSKHDWLRWEKCCLTTACLFDATLRCTTCDLQSRQRPKHASYPRERRRENG